MAKINQKFLLGQSKNPVSGTIFKSHIDSLFITLNVGSPFFYEFFCEKPKWRGKEIIVLQAMNINKDHLLLEIISKE